jgi:hypothetical protein
LSTYNAKPFTQEDKQKISKRRRKLRQVLKERVVSESDSTDHLNFETITTKPLEQQSKYMPHTEDLTENKTKNRRKRRKGKSVGVDSVHMDEVYDHTAASETIVNTNDDVIPSKKRHKRHYNEISDTQMRLSLYQ